MEQTGWSRDGIAARIGASTVALPPEEKLGARHLALWEKTGIAKMEISGYGVPSTHYDPNDRRQIKEIAAAAVDHGIEICSVHAPGDERRFAAECDAERKTAVQEAIIAGEAALEFGASILVCHLGTTSGSAKSARELLNRFAGTDLRIVVENGERLREFADFVDRVGGDRFGMVVDIGHARDADGINPFIKDRAAFANILQCSHRLFHLHLHDFNDGQDHCPPLDGEIRWEEILAALQRIGYTGALMFEPSYIHPHVLHKVASFAEKIMEVIIAEARDADEEEDIPDAKRLLEAGGDVNARGIRGETPLHTAAWSGQTGTAKLLIDSGAAVDTRNTSGNTPLHGATIWGHTDTVKMLLEQGAAADAKNGYGKTPLCRAAIFGRTETAKLLLQNGADINARDREGYTPLNWAACYGHTDTVKLLLNQGADVAIGTLAGYTPLHGAAFYGHNGIVKLLLDKGADVNEKSVDGRTPPHIAAAAGHSETARLLRRHGGKE